MSVKEKTMGNLRIEGVMVIAPNGAAISLSGLRAKAEVRGEPVLAEPLPDRGIIYMQKVALDVLVEERYGDSRKRELERAREAYFEMGGIESDIGPRDDPSWYWRRAFKIARTRMESAESKLAVKP